MFREAEIFLSHWVTGKRRKPLILRGARQVGKTELVRQFAANKKLKLAEINLERYLYLNKIFKTLSLQNISREIESITECALDMPNTLLFLDEIQATPFALQALRYFYEEKPDLPIIAAGSLLEFSLKDHNFSMPVGRIEYFHLGPMTFKEFLKAIDGYLARFITEYKVGGSIPESAHKKLLERQREYLFTGGMPEAILIFKETNSLKEVSRIHRSITNTYLDDFSKYAKQKDLVLLQKVFKAIPKMIGRKVKYSNFSKEDRSKDIKYCIDLLSKARICSLVHHSICSGIPLNAEINKNIYKIIFLDIGLVNHICGIDWLTISSYDTLQLINEGYLAEQFIGQHLLYRSKGIHTPEVVYWLREGKTANAEIDYVISQGDYIVPIEVKAGKSGSLKSLFHFVYNKQSKLAVRFDLNPPSRQQAEHILVVDNKKRQISFPLFSLPMYMVEELPKLIDEIRGNVHT